MNIFFHELKAFRKSTITWAVSLVLVVIFFLSLFPSISKDYDQFSEIIKGYPEGVRKALGLEIESFGSVLGYYSYTFLYISLCGAIQAMILGTSIVSKEILEKTADFLLTKPVTRTQVLTAKISAAAVSLAITNILYIAAANIMALQVKTNDFNEKTFLLISIPLFFVQLIFLALGIFVSIAVPKIKAVLSVSLGTVFAFFVIGMVVSSDEDKIKRYLSPFKYFDTKFIIKHSNYEIPYVIATVGIIVVCIIGSYFIYINKDVHAV